MGVLRAMSRESRRARHTLKPSGWARSASMMMTSGTVSYARLSASWPVCARATRSEEHTSELQSLAYLVCRLLLEKKKKQSTDTPTHRDTEGVLRRQIPECGRPGSTAARAGSAVRLYRS